VSIILIKPINPLLVSNIFFSIKKQIIGNNLIAPTYLVPASQNQMAANPR
jgi:hypothetical protein